MSIVGGEKISLKTEKWWNDGNTRPTRSNSAYRRCKYVYVYAVTTGIMLRSSIRYQMHAYTYIYKILTLYLLLIFPQNKGTVGWVTVIRENQKKQPLQSLHTFCTWWNLMCICLLMYFTSIRLTYPCVKYFR